MTSSTSSRRRLPRGVIAAWVIAAAVLVVLAVAVWQHLRGSSGGVMEMGGHRHASAADALARAGSNPSGAMLGPKLLTAWQLDSLALAVLVLMAAWYLTCVALVPLRSPGERWSRLRTISFLLGLLVCGYATCGAIAVYDQVLFSAHMAGHLALVMAAPALLAAGHPLSLAIASSPPRRAARIEAVAMGRVVALITAPPIALACYTCVIVGTHLTGLMAVIMRNTWIGELEHLVYVVIGYQFFILVIGDEPIRWRLAAPPRWLLLALSMAVDTFTGIVLMQGTVPIDMVKNPNVAVNTLSDTRTGGAIMWFAGDGIMAVVMVVLVIGWLRRVETEQEDEKGWLEAARRAAFTENTGAEASDPETFDEDDASRQSYNAWLSRLDGSSQGHSGG